MPHFATLNFYGFWIVGSIGTVEAQLEDTEDKAILMESTADLGRQMLKPFKSKEIFPDQGDERNQSFEIMKYMVMMLKERWAFAWDYWNTHWELKEEDIKEGC